VEKPKNPKDEEGSNTHEKEARQGTTRGYIQTNGRTIMPAYEKPGGRGKKGAKTQTQYRLQR